MSGDELNFETQYERGTCQCGDEHLALDFKPITCVVEVVEE